jgi:hypothetical protein
MTVMLVRDAFGGIRCPACKEWSPNGQLVAGSVDILYILGLMLVRRLQRESPDVQVIVPEPLKLYKV